MFFFKKNYESIDINELPQVEKNQLIDVRTKIEYQQGSLKNARHVEMNELLNNPEKYLSKEKKYYLFCASGARSASVCNILSKQDYVLVNLKGGIMSHRNC